MLINAQLKLVILYISSLSTIFLEQFVERTTFRQLIFE